MCIYVYVCVCFFFFLQKMENIVTFNPHKSSSHFHVFAGGGEEEEASKITFECLPLFKGTDTPAGRSFKYNFTSLHSHSFILVPLPHFKYFKHYLLTVRPWKPIVHAFLDEKTRRLPKKCIHLYYTRIHWSAVYISCVVSMTISKTRHV